MSDKFRLDARNVFLTYPHCNLELLDVKFHLTMKPWVQYLIICKEKHEDGSPHIHATIKFSKKVHISNERHFDIESFHPNIQAVKHFGKSVNYCKKDGDFVEYGDFAEKEKQVMIPLFHENITKLEWLTQCFEQKIPYGYAMAFWDEQCPLKQFTTLLDFDDKHKSRIQDPKLSLLVPTTDHLKSYLIVGPSGCGKTTWCKLHCEKPALMVTHMDDLKGFRINFHKSIIFDDMCFNHLDAVLQIPIVDRYDNRSVHCRYNCALIPAKIQKFFTCNVIPFDISKPQIARRINLINLY